MGKIYDDWERLVEAVVRNERFRELAMCDSTEHSTISEESSRLSVTSNSVVDDQLPLFDLLDSEIASSTCSINSSSLFSEQSLDEIASPNEVAEGALFFWNNEYTMNLIKQNCEAILPIIFSDLERNARDHWNPGVQDLTLKVRDFFYDLNPYLFKECQVKFQDDKLKEEDIKERREVMWKKLERLAARKEAIIFPQKGHHSTSQKVMNETCQGACRFFTWEDPPIYPRGTNILPKLLEQISNLESQRADLEFGIDKLLTAKIYLERELERSKRRIRDLQRANNELHARNKVIEKELERTYDLRGRDRSMLLCFSNGITEAKNKLTEAQIERRKSEIRDLQVINNELKSSNQVTEKELATIKITLRVVFLAVLFCLLLGTTYQVDAISVAKIQ